MLESLITSKTRIKLLLKFFLNPENQSYLRELAEEFDESTNGVRVELNRLTEAGLLESSPEGKIIKYRANRKHSLFQDLQNIVHKFVGIDQLVEHIIQKLGNVKIALITGDYAKGIDSGLIDLVIIGEIDRNYLHQLVDKSEKLIQRKIRTLVLSVAEFQRLKEKFTNEKALVVWKEG